MFRWIAILGLVLAFQPASATPQIVLTDDVYWADCGTDKECKGKLIHDAYQSLEASIARLCRERGYANYHIRKASSKTIEPTMTRLTVYGRCKI